MLTNSRPRDLRVDFFRGLALLIIFIDHVPNNWLARLTPGSFGFSDAAETFVFLSGYAAALAYGRIFVRAGFTIGLGRIGYRCWQLYGAHLGLFFTLAFICAAANQGLGGPINYIGRLNIVPFFEATGTTLVGLFTLTYVPNYFDILPLYILVLTLVPVMILIARIHPWLALGLSGLLYLAGQGLGWNLPADVASDRGWYFNPFCWQLLFFSGYAIGTGWVTPPAPTPGRYLLAVAFLLLCLPLAHWPIWTEVPWLRALREPLKPWIDKSTLAPLRLLHFWTLAWLMANLTRDREAWLKRLGAVVRAGQQTLPVFWLSMVLSFLGGMVLDLLGAHAWSWALVNGVGIGLLLGSAYGFAWVKTLPQRSKGPAAGPLSAAGTVVPPRPDSVN